MITKHCLHGKHSQYIGTEPWYHTLPSFNTTRYLWDYLAALVTQNPYNICHPWPQLTELCDDYMPAPATSAQTTTPQQTSDLATNPRWRPFQTKTSPKRQEEVTEMWRRQQKSLRNIENQKNMTTPKEQNKFQQVKPTKYWSKNWKELFTKAPKEHKETTQGNQENNMRWHN